MDVLVDPLQGSDCECMDLAFLGMCVSSASPAVWTMHCVHTLQSIHVTNAPTGKCLWHSA